MKQSPYDTEIEALEAEQGRISSELSEVRLKRATFLCPFNVGDILVSGRNGKKAKLGGIFSSYSGYKMTGGIIRKDGTPGRIATLYEWDIWRKEEE